MKTFIDNIAQNNGLVNHEEDNYEAGVSHTCSDVLVKLDGIIAENSEKETTIRQKHICPRCGKNVDGAHTCIPSPWLVMELKAARREVATKIKESLVCEPDSYYIVHNHMICDKIIAENSDHTADAGEATPVDVCPKCGRKMAAVGDTTMHYECLDCNDVAGQRFRDAGH